jgi:hypothetical protein
MRCRCTGLWDRRVEDTSFIGRSSKQNRVQPVIRVGIGSLNSPLRSLFAIETMYGSHRLVRESHFILCFDGKCLECLIASTNGVGTGFSIIRHVCCPILADMYGALKASYHLHTDTPERCTELSSPTSPSSVSNLLRHAQRSPRGNLERPIQAATDRSMPDWYLASALATESCSSVFLVARTSALQTVTSWS